MNSDLRQWYTNTHEFSSLLPLGGYVLHEAGLYSRTGDVYLTTIFELGQHDGFRKPAPATICV